MANTCVLAMFAKPKKEAIRLSGVGRSFVSSEFIPRTRVHARKCFHVDFVATGPLQFIELVAWA